MKLTPHNPIRILFVCHGNICRSPMAECIMTNLVNKAGLADSILVSSAATSAEELGNPIYPPAANELSTLGLSLPHHRARQLSHDDYAHFDLIIGMDAANRRNMLRLFDNDPEGKVALLLDFTDQPRDVADPWYTHDFHRTSTDIIEGCTALLKKIANR